MTEDEMIRWHHQLNEHEFEQIPGDGEGQIMLECCSLWGCKESGMTQVLNNSKLSSNTVNKLNEFIHKFPNYPFINLFTKYNFCFLNIEYQALCLMQVSDCEKKKLYFPQASAHGKNILCEINCDFSI